MDASEGKGNDDHFVRDGDKKVDLETLSVEVTK